MKIQESTIKGEGKAKIIESGKNGRILGNRTEMNIPFDSMNNNSISDEKQECFFEGGENDDFDYVDDGDQN